MSVAAWLYRGAQHCRGALLLAADDVRQRAAGAERELMGAEAAGPGVVAGEAGSCCEEWREASW